MPMSGFLKAASTGIAGLHSKCTWNHWTQGEECKNFELHATDHCAIMILLLGFLEVALEKTLFLVILLKSKENFWS